MVLWLLISMWCKVVFTRDSDNQYSWLGDQYFSHAVGWWPKPWPDKRCIWEIVLHRENSFDDKSRGIYFRPLCDMIRTNSNRQVLANLCFHNLLLPHHLFFNYLFITKNSRDTWYHHHIIIFLNSTLANYQCRCLLLLFSSALLFSSHTWIQFRIIP